MKYNIVVKGNDGENYPIENVEITSISSWRISVNIPPMDMMKVIKLSAVSVLDSAYPKEGFIDTGMAPANIISCEPVSE